MVSLTVVLAFSRVFQGLDFVGPLATVALVSHLGLLLARRRGLGLVTTGVGALVGFVLLSSWLFFLDTTTALVPTPGTWHAAGEAGRAAWSAFHQVVAPTPPLTGFVLAAAFGVFLVVFLADWAAFRLWSPVEALVSSLTLLVFTSLVGRSGDQVGISVLYAAAALLFVLEHRVTQRERSTAWLGNQAPRGSSWLLRVGVAVGLVALLLGALGGTPPARCRPGRRAVVARHRRQRQQPGHREPPGRHPPAPGRQQQQRPVHGQQPAAGLLAPRPRSTPSTGRSGSRAGATGASTDTSPRPSQPGSSTPARTRT